jgi:hypothetical protein
VEEQRQVLNRKMAEQVKREPAARARQMKALLDEHYAEEERQELLFKQMKQKQIMMDRLEKEQNKEQVRFEFRSGH